MGTDMNGNMISRFNQLLIRYRRIIQLFFGVITFLVLSYYLLQINGFPIRYINVTTLHKMILASVEIFLVVIFYIRFLRAGKSNEAKLYVVLLFLISNTLFFQPFLVYYFGSDLISQPNIRNLAPFALIAYYLLMGSTSILLVILAHRRMRSYLTDNPEKFKAFRELVDQTFAHSKEREISESQRQDKKLNNLVTSLINIPFIGNMLRSIIKFGLAESAILLLFVLVGFGLRLWNLEQIPPYIDEFSHLNAAKQLFLGTPFDEITYRRSI